MFRRDDLLRRASSEVILLERVGDKSRPALIDAVWREDQLVVLEQLHIPPGTRARVAPQLACTRSPLRKADRASWYSVN
jgi:hypothetical protein